MCGDHSQPHATLPAMLGVRSLAAALTLLVLTTIASAQEYTIELDRFGVGSVFRPGEWVAARFRVSMRQGEPTPALLVWEVENADGDIAEHTRPLVLNPGQPTSRWLSAWVQPRTSTSSVFTVRLHADVDGARGRELATVRVSPATALSPSTSIELQNSLLGVMGEVRMNLDAYSVAFGTSAVPPGMHEGTRIVAGLTPRELPDRWDGLGGFEAIIWNEPSPQSLELEESEALREYLRRGGHLVIVLPSAGNPWGLGAPPSHQLHDLLPTAAPRRIDGVPVAEIIHVLSKVEAIRNPSAVTSVQIFDAERLDRSWEPLLVIPAERVGRERVAARSESPQPGAMAGAVVAIQRPVGFGRITLIGIDVASISRMALQPGGLPQPDAFWNRVLGRRGDTPTAAELDALDKASPRRLSSDRSSVIRIGENDQVAGFIGMTGEAALNLLIAVLLFGAYWLIAGPISFALLKRFGKVRHAWLLFVLFGAIFTGVSWVSGAALRQRNVRIQHVTVLDHIARMPGVDSATEPQYQRATSWFSVYLPDYGGNSVAIASDRSDGVVHRNLLSSWMPPPGAAPRRFPNIDRYVIPYASPYAYSLPSRATATTLEARWMGPVSESVGRMPYATSPVREIVNRDGAITVRIEGKLVHGLDRTLRDVTLTHVSSFTTPLRRMAARSGIGANEPAISGELLNFGRMMAFAAWDPGVQLDLLDAFEYVQNPLEIPEPRARRNSLGAALRGRFSDRFAASIGATGMFVADSSSRRLILEAFGMFNMLHPPPWLADQASGPSVRFERLMGRELDLSWWLGRPCLIVTGFIEQDEAGQPPIPFTVDGDPPPSTGTTLIRWIMPLPRSVDAMIPEPPLPAPDPDADAESAADRPPA